MHQKYHISVRYLKNDPSINALESLRKPTKFAQALMIGFEIALLLLGCTLLLTNSRS